MNESKERRQMAIRINRVYTRKGDKGETELVGGGRIPKDSQRIEAFGTIDELNSSVGLARIFNQELCHPMKERVEAILKTIQNELFDLGSELATPKNKWWEGMPQVGSAEIQKMESLMDELQKDLSPLKSFVLPGGGKLSGFLHQCRTVCRRAEREIYRLSRLEEIGEWPLKYVNRLSDLFFVLSRWTSKRLSEPEYLWEKGLGLGRKPDQR
jgi:cob(I)alamin adenosyltransferase